VIRCPISNMRIILLACLLLTRTFGQSMSTCVNFPAGFVPFSAISYVTAADSGADHLVVGVPAAGALAFINANIPLPAFTNQTFCDAQVQLAPGQYYPNVYVPTSAEVSGNFSAFSGLLTIPGTSTPYAGGIIPPSELTNVFAWRIGAPQVPSGNGAWSPTGSMPYAGDGQAAVLLPSGKVLMVGGTCGCSAELYDPSTGAFAQVGPPNEILSPTATLLQDGRVLLTGFQSAPSTAEIYDPVADQYSAPIPMLQPHFEGATATLLNDGRVLVVGGSNGVNGVLATPSGAELFNPATETFTAAGAMSQNRAYHTAALLSNGRVLVADGAATGESGHPIGNVYNSAEIFDPTTGSFTPTGSTYAARANGYAVALPSGQVLVAGGDNPPQTAELYDPASGKFALTGAPVGGARYFADATLLSSGEVLISGGFLLVGQTEQTTASSELYIPTSASFATAASMNVSRSGHSSTLLPDGQVLVAGGDSNNVNVASSEVYTPVIQGLVTSQSGLTFRAAQGSATTFTQSVAVLSASATIPWTVSTHTYEGGNWLSVSANSGNSVPGAAPTALTITANPSGLAVQDYYGAVILTPMDGVHPPVTITIVLHIVPIGTAAPPAVTPTGLLFLGTPGATLPSQSFTITNFTSAAITFSGAGSTSPKWFTFTPSTGTIGGAQSASIAVTPTITGLNAGTYPGSITLTFGDGSSQTVDLLLVLSATAGTSSARPTFVDTTAATCTPSKLLPVFTTIGSGFNAPAAWPAPLVVDVVDNCGDPFNTGSVIVSFTDGDPPINLISTGNGDWAGTWVPQNNTAAVAVRADAQALPLTGSVQVSGAAISNPSVPVVSAGGVVSSADFASAPAIGLLVSVFGSGLADTASSAPLPLPTSLGSTSVVLSGSSTPLPLLYAANNIINVQIPYDAAIDSTQQLVVQHGNAISVPVPIAVFTASPSILSANGAGSGQGHVYVIGPGGVETQANGNAPAAAGNPVVIYCVGLGAVSPEISAGSIVPYSPLSNANAPVTVTFGNQTVPAAFAGLTPGLAGLYQVNVNVPPGVTPGNQVPVTISVGGKSSSSSIYMAIQ
jgi:uncharacterized protein (TIGR03437 family)